MISFLYLSISNATHVVRGSGVGGRLVRHIYNYLGKYINLPVTSTAQTTNTFPFIADRLLKFHSSYKYIQVSTTLMTRSLYFFLSFSLSDFIYIYKFLLTKHKDRIRPISQTVASDSEEFPTVPQ